MLCEVVSCLVLWNHSHKSDILQNFMNLRILSIGLTCWGFHTAHDLFQVSQVPKKCFKTCKRLYNSLLLGVYLLFLFFKFFKHSWVKLVLLLGWFLNGPLLFVKHWLDGDFCLVMVFHMKFYLSVSCLKFDCILFCPEKSTFLNEKIHTEMSTLSIF